MGSPFPPATANLMEDFEETMVNGQTIRLYGPEKLKGFPDHLKCTLQHPVHHGDGSTLCEHNLQLHQLSAVPTHQVGWFHTRVSSFFWLVNDNLEVSSAYVSSYPDKSATAELSINLRHCTQPKISPSFC
jgi:hypothetical protein